MRRLVVFNNVTLDGYFTGENGDLSWAHRPEAQDAEWKAFVEENSKGGGMLVMGRKTYDLMVSYWPTPEAKKNDPTVAEGMNNLPKVVFSRTLDKPAWSNTKIVKGDIAAEIQKLKNESGGGITVLGSGSIVSQLAQTGLVDEYQLVVHPVVIGKGRTMFDGVDKKLALTRTKERAFRNGNVLMCYEPVQVGAAR